MRWLIVLSIVLAVAGCGQPTKTESDARPADSVPQAQFDKLQERFDKLLVEYNKKHPPQMYSERDVDDLLREKEQLEDGLKATQAMLESARDQVEASTATPSTNSPKEAKATSRHRLPDIEKQIAGMPRWSALNEDNGRRRYGHPVGIRVEFWQDEFGVDCMMWKYALDDEQASSLGTAVWLIVIGVGGDDETIYKYNSDRIVAWEKNPTSIIPLHGGVVHVAVDGGNALFTLYGHL